MNRFLVFVLILITITACTENKKSGLQFVNKGNEVPAFSADTAYKFTEFQVELGPRVPNSDAHQKALSFYQDKLKKYAGNGMVFTQSFEAEGYNETLSLANVIAAFNPQAQDRIMLSAHWDSRPRADAEGNTERVEEAILGADDGATGVAVLLELARIFAKNPPPIGVDIVLFDGEDYGISGDFGKYFLGSRYWSENPPVPGYSPRFGILLDMVGAEEAQFPKEGYSVNFAPNLVDEVWNIADEKGFSNLFLNEKGGMISDDHYIVNVVAKIPMINIINHSTDEKGNAKFAPYWHTHNDNMENISTATLQAVGEVLLELIYNRI